jgi:hypothetical protein
MLALFSAIALQPVARRAVLRRPIARSRAEGTGARAIRRVDLNVAHDHLIDVALVNNAAL